MQMVCDRGITHKELIEFLEVSMTMQGCPGEEWALMGTEGVPNL